MDYAGGKIDVYSNVEEAEDYDAFVAEQGYREQDVYYMVTKNLQINHM